MGAILNYRLEFNDPRTITVNASQEDELVTKVVSGLTSGTQYTFTVFAVFENISSSGRDFHAATGKMLFSECVQTELCFFYTEWGECRG